MNITYSYRIDGIDIAPTLDGLNKVITRVGFSVVGNDSESGFESSFFDRIDFLNPDPDNFTAFSDVTEDDVIGWVSNAYTNIEMAERAIESNIQAKITPMFKPVDTPWGEPMHNNPTE